MMKYKYLIIVCYLNTVLYADEKIILPQIEEIILPKEDNQEKIILPKKEETIVNSTFGFNIIKSFKHALVVTYEDRNNNLYGSSGSPDGKIIKSYKDINFNQASQFKNIILNNSNYTLKFMESEDKVPRNWNQGVEFTDGLGYVRVYFTHDGKYCKFFTSSGEGGFKLLANI